MFANRAEAEKPRKEHCGKRAIFLRLGSRLLTDGVLRNHWMVKFVALSRLELVQSQGKEKPSPRCGPGSPLTARQWEAWGTRAVHQESQSVRWSPGGD